MQYKILKESSTYDLELAVNKLIEQGYEPLGNITVISGNGFFDYFQAMIKKGKK